MITFAADAADHDADDDETMVSIVLLCYFTGKTPCPFGLHAYESVKVRVRRAGLDWRSTLAATARSHDRRRRPKLSSRGNLHIRDFLKKSWQTKLISVLE